jgi:hypothetical protein
MEWSFWQHLRDRNIASVAWMMHFSCEQFHHVLVDFWRESILPKSYWFEKFHRLSRCHNRMNDQVQRSESVTQYFEIVLETYLWISQHFND